MIHLLHFVGQKIHVKKKVYSTCRIILYKRYREVFKENILQTFKNIFSAQERRLREGFLITFTSLCSPCEYQCLAVVTNMT